MFDKTILLLCAALIQAVISINDDPSQAPAICAEQGSDSILVAHEECDKFYKCFEGKPVAISCPKPLLYNPAKEYCDWPDNVNCGKLLNVVKLLVVPGLQEFKLFKVNDDPSQAPAICAEQGSDSVLVAHEECDKFYKCFEGKPVAIDCPKPLLYNPEKEYCDWPDNVNCKQEKYLEVSGLQEFKVNEEQSQAVSICGAEDSDGLLVAHEDCDKFYECSGGKPVVFKCPKPLLFNPEKDLCDWPDNVECKNQILN